MATAVARRYGDRFLAAVAAQPNESAEDAIGAYRLAFREALDRDGRMCLCGALGAEAGVLSPDVAGEILSFFRRCIDDLSRRIGGLDAEARAFHVIATLEGGSMLARVYGDIEAFDQAAAGLIQPWRGADHGETLEAQRRRSVAHRRDFSGNQMAAELDPGQIAAAERHNRLAKEIVSEIVYAPICDGGTMSDVMMLCESVLVGVLLECFKLGDDVKMLDLIVGRVKERLAKARLEDLETKGNG